MRLTRGQTCLLLTLAVVACLIFISLAGVLSSTMTGPPAQVAATNPPPSPTNTPLPELPQSGIKITRQELVDSFERRLGFTWIEQASGNEIQVTGTSPTGRQKINIWSPQADPENIREIAYSFRFEHGTGDIDRRAGLSGLELASLVLLPDWPGREAWFLEHLEAQSGEAKTVVDGATVYLEQESEPEDYLVILTVIEE